MPAITISGTTNNKKLFITDQKVGCVCCGKYGAGSRVCDTKTVTVENGLVEEAVATHPFSATGCGCSGIDDTDPAVCEIKERYRYGKVTTLAADGVQWDGGVGQDPVGGTSTSEYILDPSPPDLREIDYSVCPACVDFDQFCFSALEYRHISDKLVGNDIVGEVTNNEDCEEVGCLCEWEDACDGAEGEDPEYAGTLLRGSCAFNNRCTTDDDEVEPQAVTITYEDEIDLANLPYEDLLVQLQEIDFPADWRIRVCSGASNALWPTCAGDFVAISTGLENYCNYISKSAGSFEKKKIRFRFVTPSSCYIKIWVCKFAVIRTFENGELQDCILSSSTVTTEVLAVPNIGDAKCFDGFNNVAAQNLSNIVSSEIDLIPPPGLVWPEPPEPPGPFDPELYYFPATNTERIAAYGAGIIGISYVDGWQPPLLQYDSEVWKNRASLIFAGVEELCPYFIAPVIGGSEINPHWPMTNAEQAEYLEYFNEFVNVNPVP